jgi:hypothetical protein
MSHTGSLRIRESPYLALRRRRHAAKPSIALPTNARLAGSGTGVKLPLTKPVVVALLVLLSSEKLMPLEHLLPAVQKLPPVYPTSVAVGMSRSMKGNVVPSSARMT